jgi:hypothetical protein
MPGLIANILLMLLVFVSFPVGYFIGTFTESEIEKTAEKIRVDKVFSSYAIIAEIAIVLLLFAINSDFYALAVSILIIMNIILSAMHASIKSDMVKLIGYGVMFTVATLVGSLMIELI